MGHGSRALETLVIDPKFWQGRKVFLTGHTGFKGSWVALLLSCLGARTYGYALPPEREIDLFRVAGLERDLQHRIGDVRDMASLRQALQEARPDVVIHMAAQAIVRASYVDPVGTYATNVMGTVNLLEAVRRHPDGIQAVVIVTSDKCYDNKGSSHSYREIDPLGGHDPYSSSKGCAELVTSAYRRSFFSTGRTALASVRAGNVIGGGDWGADRLVPDAMRAFLSGGTATIRNPHAVRPWQHVLDPISAYIRLTERIAKTGGEYAEAWNFGPAAEEISVEEILRRLARIWGPGANWKVAEGHHPHEAAVLTLDCTKAASRLGWRPAIDLDEALQLTVDWYRLFGQRANMRDATLSQIESFLERQKAGPGSGVVAAS